MATNLLIAFYPRNGSTDVRLRRAAQVAAALRAAQITRTKN